MGLKIKKKNFNFLTEEKIITDKGNNKSIFIFETTLKNKQDIDLLKEHNQELITTKWYEPEEIQELDLHISKKDNITLKLIRKTRAIQDSLFSLDGY
jgi:outer membrane lipoprotein-sorting protein